VELEGIKGMWSLRSSIEDAFDTFLVATFIGETRILRMNHENDLEEAEIKGFSCQVQTFFCHEAVHNQLVQVGSELIFLQ
jgi:DNA damage-binding protein 1